MTGYRTTGSKTTDVEQAIARNESVDRICRDHNVRRAFVYAVMARIDAAHHAIDHDGDDKQWGIAGAGQRYVDRIRELNAEGLADWQIAVQLHISSGYVGKLRRQNGIPAVQAGAA